MQKKVRIAVVDDHPLFRGGVVHTLATREEFEIVGEGASAEDAIRLADEFRPDVILLDLNMPGGGLTAMNEIVAKYASVRPLMLTVMADAATVKTAMRLGAFGYLVKGIGSAELIETVLAVSQGRRYVSPSFAAQVLSGPESAPADNARLAPQPSNLTNRERQVLAFVSRGLSNKEIGTRLALSDKTVKHHLTGLLRKLHVRNRVEAAIVGRRAEEATSPQADYDYR